jgi:hypothetical protein
MAVNLRSFPRFSPIDLEIFGLFTQSLAGGDLGCSAICNPWSNFDIV